MKRNGFTKEQTGKLKRLERAKEILAQGKLFPITGAEEEKFIVFSQTAEGKRLYLVDRAEGTCTCPDFQKNQRFNGGWCKHRIAVMLKVEHPDDWSTWLPDWAKEQEQEQESNHNLDKALAELTDEVLERLIKLLTQEQMDRDYRRQVEAEV